MASQMERALATAEPQPQQQQYAPQQQQPQAAAGPQPPDPDLLYSNPAEWQRQNALWTAHTIRDTLTQTAAPWLQQQSTTARDLARMDPEMKPIWDRYGPEIDMVVQQIPQQQRTKQMYMEAAKVVRGNHWRDLAAEEAEKIAQQRSGGGGASESSQQHSTNGTHTNGGAPGDAISHMFRENGPVAKRFREQNLSEHEVRQAARKLGFTPEEYVQKITDGRRIAPTYQTRDGHTAAVRSA